MVIIDNKNMMLDMLNDIFSIRLNIVNQYFIHIMIMDSQDEEIGQFYKELELI